MSDEWGNIGLSMPDFLRTDYIGAARWNAGRAMEYAAAAVDQAAYIANMIMQAQVEKMNREDGVGGQVNVTSSGIKAPGISSPYNRVLTTPPGSNFLGSSRFNIHR